MYLKQRTSSIAAIVISLFSFTAVCYAQDGTGKLVKTNVPPSQAVNLLKRPPCKAPPCAALINDLSKVIKLNNPSQIGILVTPVNGDIELTAFSLQITFKEQVVFATQPVNEMLKFKSDARYLFVLDEKAIDAAGKFFVPQNTLGFTAKQIGKGEASATFSMVYLDGARPPDVNKQPASPQKGKP
jgi:hypothetical protein